MDKYPVFGRSRRWGELTVTPEALYTAFFRLLPGAGGTVVRVGDGGDRESPYRCSGTGERLPANPPPVFQTVDRPVGTHPPGRTAPFRRGAGAVGTAETGTAEKSIPPLPLGRAFRCADLPAGQGRLIAVPRDDAAPFPLEAMFCFARSRRLQGRAYWVFRFDDREWPVF